MAVSETCDSPSKIKGLTCSLYAELRNFSDENIHKPRVHTTSRDVLFKLDDPFQKTMIVVFYGNGNHGLNEGYVSIVFNFKVSPIVREEDLCFTCFVAVEDAAGSRRFERSFMFPRPRPSMQFRSGEDMVMTYYTIDKYIARETLLEERDELLPDDCLKLRVEVNLRRENSHWCDDLEGAIISSYDIEVCTDGPTIVLSLYSYLAKCLYEVSSVFRALCDTPMLEKDAGFVRLPCDDVGAFKSACCIIMGAKTISFNDEGDIVSLYIFADKYDIQNVIRACRNFFETVLNINNAPFCFEANKDEIWKLATLYNDDILKEIVVRSVKIRSRIKNALEMECRTADQRRRMLKNFEVLDENFQGRRESPPLYRFVLKQGNEEFDFYR